MRKVRLIEDVVNEQFIIKYKDWWFLSWKHFRTFPYQSETNQLWNTRESVYEQAKRWVNSLEKEKVIYETPKRIYY